MFNFRGNLSQLPSLYFLLISFTYVTVIKGVHLSFLVAMERTGFYTGAFHKAPLTGSCHHEQTWGRNKVQYWTCICGAVAHHNERREFVYEVEANPAE